MSVAWTVDHGHSPILVLGSMTLAVHRVQADAAVPAERVSSTIDEQVSWWNRQSETIDLYGSRYRLCFRISQRRSRPADGFPDASHVIWSRASGEHVTRVDTVLQRHPDYHRGLVLVLASTGGYRSEFSGTAIIRWTSYNVWLDSQGPRRSLTLAHEIGHGLGLGHTYAGGGLEDGLDASGTTPRLVRDSRGRSYRTLSLPGWERNIMADVDADRHRLAPDSPGGRVFAPGAAWLGQTLARNLVLRVLEAPHRAGISSMHGVRYFVTDLGRPDYPNRGCGWR